MKWLNSYRIRLVLFGFAVGLVVGGGSANADFTFGTPTNLGPIVNSSYMDAGPCISADGLSLYFSSDRPGGSGDGDLWVATRATKYEDWGNPVNLGPTVNTSSHDDWPSISSDGLSLFFQSNRSGGYGSYDLWVTKRTRTDDDWGTAVNLGPTVNSSALDGGPNISADDLTLFFGSTRLGGSGSADLWVTTRPSISDTWGTPVNLGSTVNSSSMDFRPSISTDGLSLFFHSNRPGGLGDVDLWVATRAATNDPWEEPVNLGSTLNSPSKDGDPSVSADCSTLYFFSGRPGGVGSYDLWQAPIIPIVDFNGDGIVDSADMCIMIDYWGTDEPSCDIGPTPLGDGIVDVQDLIVLAEHLFEEIPPLE